MSNIYAGVALNGFWRRLPFISDMLCRPYAKMKVFVSSADFLLVFFNKIKCVNLGS
jgi:hypothetical protein